MCGDNMLIIYVFYNICDMIHIKFLNKVVNQIIYETYIDYDRESIIFPFVSFSCLFSFSYSFPSPSFPLSSFKIHCKDIYSLNDKEIKYLWKEYEISIKDKIKNQITVL
jgi:hypothetical protein